MIPWSKKPDYTIVAPRLCRRPAPADQFDGPSVPVALYGFDKQGVPTSISLLGRLEGEAALIAVGRAIQASTHWEEQRPPLFK